jgi:hypothetical protein
MPKKTTTFVEDIVIHTNDGKTKLLTKAALKKLPSVGDDLKPVVDTLLQRGVVVAAIPSSPGVGASCYLLNLKSICHQDDDK